MENTFPPNIDCHVSPQPSYLFCYKRYWMVANGGATLIYTRAWHFRDCMNYSLVFVFSNGSVIISVPEEGVLFLPSLPLASKKPAECQVCKKWWRTAYTLGVKITAESSGGKQTLTCTGKMMMQVNDRALPVSRSTGQQHKGFISFFLVQILTDGLANDTHCVRGWKPVILTMRGVMIISPECWCSLKLHHEQLK